MLTTELVVPRSETRDPMGSRAARSLLGPLVDGYRDLEPAKQTLSRPTVSIYLFCPSAAEPPPGALCLTSLCAPHWDYVQYKQLQLQHHSQHCICALVLLTTKGPVMLPGYAVKKLVL